MPATVTCSHCHHQSCTVCPATFLQRMTWPSSQVQTKVHCEHDRDKDDDPGKQRRRIVGLRSVQDEIAQALRSRRYIRRSRRRSPHTELRSAIRERFAAQRQATMTRHKRLRPGCAHQARQSHQLLVDRQQARIGVEEDQKETVTKTTAILDAMPSPSQTMKTGAKGNLGNAVETNNVGLQSGRQKTGSAENKSQRSDQTPRRAHSPSRFRQRHINVPVNVVMAQQIVKPRRHQRGPAEIWQRRVGHAKLPARQQYDQNRKLRCE